MTLSDKYKTAQARGDNFLTHMYYEQDVKEFIKDLKKHESKNTINGIKFIIIGVDELDELAGEKLI